MRSTALQSLLPVVAVAAMLPGLVIGPSLDASVFVVLGQGLRDGALPYVDLWDHKPPGIYAANALADVALGWFDPWLAAWTVSVIGVSLAGLATAGALRRIGLERLALVGGLGAVIGVGHYLLSLGGGLTEQLAVAPAAAAVAVLAGGFAGRGQALVAGLLLGLAAVISLQLMPAGVAALVLIATTSHDRAGRLVALLAGTAMPIAAVVGVLAFAGALPAARDAIVGYNVAYGQLRSSTVGAVAPWAFLSLLFLVVPAVFGAAALRRASPEERRLGLGSLAWIAATIAMVALMGRLYGHYVAPMAVPLAWLGVIGLRDMAPRLRRRTPLRVIMPVALLAAAAISTGVAVAGGRMEAESIAQARQSAAAVDELLLTTGAPDETLLVWGNQPIVHLETARPPASRYVYLYPLTTPGYATEARIQAFLRDLEQDPPTHVIDAGAMAGSTTGFLPLLVSREVATDGRSLDRLDPIRRFVESRYELLGTGRGWPVYQLRP